nr:immunoglobulin light chain junction region [Macaca mulatta]MOW13532.1 immunoglobulin light chain junction region [Macaca mulatta]MOW14630.1 immunoglobulin light chain junction region [Macaca mulatta]MOW14640.1 immunoglobulin light chain junction region [Macaca mulatta]MOX84565.1 immunoglobulin light chain junction region [Macaca mulatta]
CLQYNSDPFTF